MNRKLIRMLAAAGILACGVANADDYLCSVIGPEINSDVNGNVFVDVDCTVTDGAFINGNMIQTVPGTNLTVGGGAEVNGNLDKFVDGVVTIRGKAHINGNVYNPDKVMCRNASVNGNIDDNNSCAGIGGSCSVNGAICGVGDTEDPEDPETPDDA